MEIHQLVHTLSYGDAISGEVLALQRCFQECGWNSEIYAINVHPKLKGAALDYRELDSSCAGEVILHYSLGSPLNDLYRSLKSAKRSIIYHNLTPATWFDGVNPRVAEDIRQGAKELPELCRISDRVIADSAYNASELEPHGCSPQVLPLPFDPVRWQVETNPGIADLLRSQGEINLLHVGRLAPNKCVEDIIKTFYFLHHKIERRSKLWLAGIDIDTELYSFSLKRLVHELDLVEAVKFVGCMADSELKALYENSTAYMCMSEHEGFCLPVVEAMNYGLPVIAYAATALPDTVGSGGILVKEKRHPEMAELVYKIHTDAGFASTLKEAGRKRVEDFSMERFKSAVSSLFGTDAESRVLDSVA